MLKKLLQGNIVFNSEELSWQEAVQLSAQPLLDGNLITQYYLEEIIKSVEKQGFYIVISPDVALPHARFPQGVKQVCLSLLVSAATIQFGENPNSKLVFCVGFVDDTSHMEMLQNLAMFLSDEGNLKKLLEAKTESDVLNLL
ncbi:MAG: PTS sugar transporter subunit IIA [Alphaproteobacteria bacterium]|nr:PTS sugar transporter subunit IIA [Alphaproteobacteria bacterium]